MPDTLNEAKEIVRAITKKSGNSKIVTAGVIMIAPMFCKSFRVDDIVKATGYTRNQIERAALNLWRYGIWTNDEAWCCEWGRLFAGEIDKLTENEVWELSICFILDALVAEGFAMREGSKRKDFKYKSL